MDIKKMKIDNLTPAYYNPRKDLQPSDIEYVKLKRSIETFGYVDPIIFNKKTGTVVGGHQRLKVLKDLGYDEIDVNVIDISEQKEKALNIALNKISGEFDLPLLKDLLLELDTEGFDIELTGFELEEFDDILEDQSDNEDDVYTDKVEAPTYEMTGEEPEVVELYDMNKAHDLERSIRGKEIPSEIKDFLIASAQRHNVFNYAKIAEYYAHADKEVQELMEDSALVIIDYDKAIEQGFATVVKETMDTVEDGDFDE